MATNLWFCITRLRDEAVCNGHAMPISTSTATLILSGKDGITVHTCASLVVFGNDGCSVPISRGSPPTP